ncbi:MAG: hypothetical protein K1X75_12845 [Leptospirales bacterium]|nr:hypothetical protein [Leptospirales bacterium]
MLIKILLVAGVVALLLNARRALDNLRALFGGIRDELEPPEKEVRGRTRMIQEGRREDR